MQNEMPMTTDRSQSKPEVEFNMAGVRFPKPEVVITQPWIEISLRNLVHLERSWPSEDTCTTKPEPEVDSRCQRPASWKF